MAEISNINIATNPYWQKITEDSVITRDEAKGFNSVNTGLPPETAAKGRAYLEGLLDIYRGDLKIEQLPQETLSQILRTDSQAEKPSGIPWIPSCLFKKISNLMVTKAGRNDHHDLIYAARDRIKFTEFKLVDSQQISENLFKSTLFEMLQDKLNNRLGNTDLNRLQASFYSFLDTKFPLLQEALTVNTLLSTGYHWLLDYLELVDLPEDGEALGAERFETFRTSAQGPFASSCGLYALLSLIESFGKMEEFRQANGLNTYEDLDLYTGELMIREGSSYEDNNPYYLRNPYEKGRLFRDQGLSMPGLSDIGSRISNPFGLSFTYHEKVEVDVNRLLLSHPQGFLAAISTDVGPHAVHVLMVRDGLVFFYDPIGLDGRLNIQAASLPEFNCMWLDMFGIITAHEDKPPAPAQKEAAERP